MESSTVCLGIDSEGKEVYVPMKQVLPMVDPNILELDGECNVNNVIRELCI